MNRKQIRSHKIDMIFPVILFFIFAMCAIAVLILAVGSYRRTVEQTMEHYTGATAVAYIHEKIRQGDTDGAVHIDTYAGEPALVITQEISGITCCTYIYNYEGSIYELFCREDAGIGPEAGAKIIDQATLGMSEDDKGLIQFTLTDDQGHTETALIYPRSRERN